MNNPLIDVAVVKCLPESPHDLTLALTTLITLLDIITDILGKLTCCATSPVITHFLRSHQHPGPHPSQNPD